MERSSPESGGLVGVVQATAPVNRASESRLCVFFSFGFPNVAEPRVQGPKRIGIPIHHPMPDSILFCSFQPSYLTTASSATCSIPRIRTI